MRGSVDQKTRETFDFDVDFRRPPAGVIRSRAPLRVGLAGGGTDVSPYCDEFGGAILNATIDYYCYTTIEITADATVEFFSADQLKTTKYEARRTLALDGEMDLFKAVYNYVVRVHNNKRPLSLKLSTQVDVPPGSGLGGSSTLVVSMLKAYAELLSLRFSEYDLANTAYVIERCEAGLQGGKQDQYAAAFGGFNFMEFGAENRVLVNPLRIKDWVISEIEASLILFYTGRSRSSATIIEEQSNNARNRDCHALDAMHRIRREAWRMKECLLRGDFPSLYGVLQSSWDAKKSMARHISNDLLDSVYECALNAGAHCGKISGAGGGGFMIFLADPIRRNQVTEALRSCHSDGLVFPCHFTSQGSQAWRVK